MTAALAANGGIPAGLRKKIAVDVAGVTGHAAGIVFVAPDGDILLLRRSSAETNYAGHWGLPGGGANPEETPEQAADRESVEETGFAPGPKKLLDQRRTPNGLAFHTFASPVAEKFVPKLDHEHTGYAWAPLDMLPQPLHPAVGATLKDRVGVAQDMTPEDWTGLRDGFAKWTREEERESEHAAGADSVIKLALDRDSVRTDGKDGQLHVAVTNISKATVNPYRGTEIPGAEELGLDLKKVYHLLRDPEELRRAAPTFNNLPLLSKHIPVTAQNYDQKIKPYVIGSTGTDAEFEAPYLRNSMVVWSGASRLGIDSGEQKEISIGYHYRADMTPGNFDGNAYDGVMRDIVGNHVTLVEDGRAGADVVVGDSNEEINAMSKEALARKIHAISGRTVTFGALVSYLRPRLAMDAKVDLSKAFDGVTGKNFPERKSAIAASIKTQAQGKLAMDANLDDVGKVLEMLEKHEIDGASDEVIEPAEHQAIEAAAGAMPVPAIAAPAKDGGGMEGLKGFLKEKGMGEDDIMKACDMAMPKPALDEDDEAKKKKADEEKKAKEDADAKTAKDAEMKDMVTKPAMDAALKATADATAKQVRETERGIRVALDEVRPYVGEISPKMAFDSGEDVYRHALVMRKVPDASTLPGGALAPILRMLPKAGARPVEHDSPPLGMDEAALTDFDKMFPSAGRIGVGG